MMHQAYGIKNLKHELTSIRYHFYSKSMKITGGQAKGIPIRVSKKSTVRPATDYLRQAIFSSLGNLIENAKFLDLFAGTGVYGLEAWSRGAQGGVFVEKDKNCLITIKQNIDSVAKSLNSSPSNCKVFPSDVFKIALPLENHFDLIFADPPYEITKDIFPDLLNLVAKYLKKSPSSRLIIEAPGQFIPSEHPDIVFLKKIGKDSINAPSALIWKSK